ncbi:MAG: ABC transporter substrate-binding protein [Sedimenticola sp.]
MKPNHRSLILSLLAGTFLWSNGGVALALEPLTVQLRWFHSFQFAGYYAAIEKGYYRQEGLDVVLRERDPATSYVDEVVEGRAEYGIDDAGLLAERVRLLDPRLAELIHEIAEYLDFTSLIKAL